MRTTLCWRPLLDLEALGLSLYSLYSLYSLLANPALNVPMSAASAVASVLVKLSLWWAKTPFQSQAKAHAYF